MAAVLSYTIDGSEDEGDATSGALAISLMNGAFGELMVEEPIDFSASLAVYPHDQELIEEPDWELGGTPVGI